MQPSMLLQTIIAFAAFAHALPSEKATPVKDSADSAPSGATGYGLIGGLATVQNPSLVFNPVVTSEDFSPTTPLNPACAALCRNSSTQYYAVIDYQGQCACGNVLSTSYNYTVGGAGLGICGGKYLDEGYTVGPGVCGDYYYGAAAIYSLDF